MRSFISLGFLSARHSTVGCDYYPRVSSRFRGKNEPATFPSALSCTTWGFSCDSAYAKIRWALTPPFHPYPARSVASVRSVVSCQLILTYSFAAKMRPPRFGNIWLRISVLFNRQLTLATDLTLTTDRAGRFIFCDTFRYPEFPLRIPSFSRGMPPSGVRTFLWPDKFQASDRLPLLERIPWTWIEIQPRHSAFTVCRSPKMLCAPVQVLRSSRRPRPI